VTALLALFDVDGTLLLTHDPLAGIALRETLTERYSVILSDDAIEQVDHQGQTSLRIGRLVLAAAGIEEPERLVDWCGEFAERYLELLTDADTGNWQVSPDAERSLERLAAAGLHLALLTGNPEPMARARMDRLHLARFFPHGQGAFGCESESRVELIAFARARAGNWEARATVEVGDTERDATTSREAGIRSIVVGPGGLGEAAEQLLAWNRRR
jgi:phosphoglycolate phosphatase-like HAD superfamily hydrolase